MGPSQEPEDQATGTSPTEEDRIFEFPSLEGSGVIRVHSNGAPPPQPPPSTPTSGGDWAEGVKFPRREGGE
jgi:hypothetical protein